MRKSKHGGRNHVARGKRRGATKNHYHKANKTQRGHKGSKKHAKKTHRRRHRGGSGGLISQLAGNFDQAVIGPLKGVLGSDSTRSQLKADLHKLESAQNAVAKDVQQIYKAANENAASVVNKPGSAGAVAVLQQLANSQPQTRNAFPNYSLIRP